MATQFGSMLEPTSHQDHDMISDSGDIDLDVDFVINTEQTDQEVILGDAPSGDHLPDEIMQEDDRGQGNIVAAHMQDEEVNYDSKMDDPTSKFSSAEMNMTGVDEVHIDFDFGQHDTLIGDEIQLPDEDEITWNEPANNSAQDAESFLDQQGQASSLLTITEPGLHNVDISTNPGDDNDSYADPQATTAVLHLDSGHGDVLDNTNNSALASGPQPPNIDSIDLPTQEESEDTDPGAEAPEDGVVQLDEISYEDDDDVDEPHIKEHEAESDEQHNNYQEGEYSNDDYNALLYYKGTPTCLFPPSPDSEGLPNTSLLKSSALADSPLPELFHACREALGTDIDANHGLRMEVTCFGLSINEDDPECPNVTIAQIIDVYYHLNSNDELYEPSLMEVNLSIRRKLSTQLNDLFKAAEAGKGFTSVQGSKYEFQDDDADNDHATSEEDEASDGEQNRAAEESNRDNIIDPNDPNSTDFLQLAAKPAEETNSTTDSYTGGIAPEAPEYIDSTAETKTLQPAAASASTTETSSKDTVQNDEEDDLIDYSDDEVENEEAPETSRSSTIQDDHTPHDKKNVTTASTDVAAQASFINSASENVEHEENDDDFLLDFGNDDDPDVGAENDLNPAEASTVLDDSANDQIHSISSTHLQFELKVGDDSLKEDSRDAGFNQPDDPLDFELEFGSGEAAQSNAPDATSLEVDYNDLIDFEDDDQGPDEQTATGTTVPSDSPTGKRTWDEHAEDIGADGSEKELKRMKSG